MKVLLSICELTRSIYPKKRCVENLMNVFRGHEIYVLGDNLGDDLSNFIQSFNPTHFENKLRGRNFWFREKIEFACNNFENEDILYFVEDDYLHQKDAPTLLEEGIVHSDYVTLYDHPDKYQQHPNRNPEITDLGENTVLFLTKTSHWKYTNSTTVTFACKKSTLKQDSDVWVKHFIQNVWWSDYPSFVELRQTKQRKIACCIPGRSTHLCDRIMYSPFFEVP